VLTGVLIGGLSRDLGVGLRAGLIFGLIGGPSISVGAGLGCWSESPLRNGVISGLLCGLICGLICLIVGPPGGLTSGLIGVPIGVLLCGPIGGLGVGSLNHITLVEIISWNWNQFWKRTIPGSIVGLIFGLLYGLVSTLFYLAFMARAKPVDLNFLVTFGVLVTSCLIFGIIFGLLSGLVGGFTDRVKVGKASPNQGIKLSRKNSLIVFVVTCLAVGLIGLLIGGLIGLLMSLQTKEVPYLALLGGLIGGLSVGIFVGLIGGLKRGGSAVIKHYALRLILSMNGYMPFNFIKFLDHCARLILLKKVGGSYIFIHRMLLEYFAELDTSQNSAIER
jgi:hypothetical protein